MANQPLNQELLVRRRNLPHWQQGGSVYFITFRSKRGPLPDTAKQQVIANILYDHGKKYDLYLGLVMPDHVHLILQPRQKTPGFWYDLSEIMKGIKGVSARRINQMLGTSGSVWQDESYDRIIRDEEEYLEKWNYIWNNPVKAGLAVFPEEYPYFVFPETTRQ
jgi:REP element-mobilizing transposase RayT